MGRGALALLLSSLAPGCSGTGVVTRLVRGRPIEGRFISERAYASYLEGVILETQGKLAPAAQAYARAAREDTANADAWVRLGAVRCSLVSGIRRDERAASQEEPWTAFDRAARIDASYEALWTERARCHLAQHAGAQAIEASRRAVALDPDSVEAATLLARALEAGGQRDDALRWLDGLVVREPASREAHHALLDFAIRNGETARAEAARRALGELGARDDRSSERYPQGALRGIDDALASDDIGEARRLARRAHLSDGVLALRAAALGRLAAARDRGDRVLLADPSDADARVATLVAADLARDDAALTRSARATAESTELSPLAQALLDELLLRRVGRDAVPQADATAPRPTGDPLLDAVRVRNRRSR